MPYWEFLIQRENDRAWRPLTNRKLEIFEGHYRIIANTSMSNSAVHTQIFYQNHEQSPQLVQDHSHQISNEGLLVVMPFTHIQLGTWHLNCNVAITKGIGVEEQLCLRVVSRAATDEKNTPPLPVEKNMNGLEDRSKATVTVIHDYYPMVISDIHPEKLIASSMADLDSLLTEIAPVAEQPVVMSHDPSTSASTSSLYPEFIKFPEEGVLDLSTLPIDQVFEVSDPLATALQIGIPSKFSDSESDDLLIHSYDCHSYEVVVED